jgi:acetyltransferase-like isoleucine patch superfamily enzyme
LRFTRRIQLGLRRPLRPVTRFGLFFVYNTHFIDGDPDRLQVGERVGLANTLCNLASGSIFIGDDCAFGYNVMLLTGRHQFIDGYRASLLTTRDSSSGWGGGSSEVPDCGFDIRIGDGCWIASGVVVSGGVTIGRNAIIASNAVVTNDIPDFAIAAGIPAKVIGDTRKSSPDVYDSALRDSGHE